MISVGTHKGTLQLPYNQQLPLTSLYERSGHLLSIDGHYRKHQKVVSTSGGRRSLESLLSAFCRRQGAETWCRWSEGLATFADEIGLGSTNLSAAGDTTTPIVTGFNSIPSLIDSLSLTGSTVGSTKGNNIQVKLVPFHPTVRNFYVQDPISAHSPTRGECSLFIGRELNFTRE